MSSYRSSRNPPYTPLAIALALLLQGEFAYAQDWNKDASDLRDYLLIIDSEQFDLGSPPSSVPAVTPNIRHFSFRGNSLVSGDTLLRAATTALSLDQKTAADGDPHHTLREALKLCYQDAGYGLVAFKIPVLPAADGTLPIEIIELTLGRIEIAGSAQYTEEDVTRMLPALKPGKAINSLRLLGQIAEVNKHGNLHLDVDFKPGNTPGTADVIVSLQGEKNYSLSLMTENSALQAVGHWLTGVNYTHHDVWGRNHVLGISYITSVMRGAAHATVANYTIPFPELDGQLTMNAASAQVNAVNIMPGLGVLGQGQMYSAYYQQVMARHIDSKLSLGAGIDYKLMEATVVPPINLITIQSNPLVLGFHFGNIRESGIYEFEAKLYRNFASGGLNTQANYQAYDPNSTVNFSALRANAKYEYTSASDWMTRLQLNLQQSSAHLPLGENLNIGGMRAVRGIPESTLLFDTGLVLRSELYLPSLPGNSRLLGFVDMGTGTMNSAFAIPGVTIGSFGLGWRMVELNGFNLRLDLARVLKGTPQITPGSMSGHLHLDWQY